MDETTERGKKRIHTNPFRNGKFCLWNGTQQHKRNYRTTRIIHFSVHGLFFSDSPELNSLALTSRDTASKYTEEELKAYEEKYGKLNRDGFLKMGDVAELDLKTDLLVMSACETSLGTVKAGEGMVGLPQAFLMGGANNFIMLPTITVGVLPLA